MNLPIDRERLKLYLRIGGAYVLLWLFVDLVSHPKLFHQYLRNEIWRGVYMIAVNYLFFEYILPKIGRKRIFKSFLRLAFQLFLCSAGLYIWRSVGIQLQIFTPFKTYTSTGHGVGEQLGDSIFSLLFFGIIRHVYHYRRLKEAAQQLRIEKQEAELNFLKSQTNPHFLFNTLNNIYSLARDKSDLAPESILRLSKILRFMLYETGGAYIAVEQELKIMHDYLALEQLRYDESLRVNFNHDIEDRKQALPPLLLLPLVENAFKHGISETRDQPFLDIHLSINQRQLWFVVKNSTETCSEAEEVKENIGLSNLRRQLQLLYSEYSLSVHQGESVFTATLKINLGSHVKTKVYHR
ncbi:MAG: histidine kinase [Spirosomataceae bacterium]